jgi:hypothetical protein
MILVCERMTHNFYDPRSVPFATSVNRLAFKRVRPYFLEKDGSSGLKKKFYDLVSLISTLLCMHYFVMPFQAMSLENSLASLKNTYFAGHITCAVLYVVFSLVPAPRAPKKKGE